MPDEPVEIDAKTIAHTASRIEHDNKLWIRARSRSSKTLTIKTGDQDRCPRLEHTDRRKEPAIRRRSVAPATIAADAPAIM